MNIADIRRNLIPRGIVKIDSRVGYSLTETGKVRAEDYHAERGIRLQVLSYLDDHGVSKLRDIARDLEIKDDAIKEVLRRLVTDGYVRVVPV